MIKMEVAIVNKFVLARRQLLDFFPMQNHSKFVIRMG